MTEANVTVTDNAANEAANGKKEKGLQKRRRGYVVSDKMDKTIAVSYTHLTLPTNREV